MTIQQPHLGSPLPPAPPRRTIGRHIRSSLITGLIILFPLFLTITVLLFIYDKATALFSQPLAKALLDHYVKPWVPETALTFLLPVLAIVITILVVYTLGVLSTFVIGKRILAVFEHFIENLPLVKGIYGTTKQVIGVFRQGSGSSGFQRVVLVEFPRAGTWAVAFVTNTVTDTATRGQFVCCFIPMTPNPTSGFFQVFAADQVRETDWSVDQGLKIILSGGLLAPSELQLTGPASPPASA